MSGLRLILERLVDAFGNGRPESPTHEAGPPAAGESGHEYHCVTIKVPAGGETCAAITKLLGQRFLSTDAPKLPLPECTVSQCQCRYRHYEDRRHETRRESDKGLSDTRHDGPEVRDGGERRNPERETESEAPEVYPASDYFNS